LKLRGTLSGGIFADFFEKEIAKISPRTNKGSLLAEQVCCEPKEQTSLTEYEIYFVNLLRTNRWYANVNREYSLVLFLINQSDQSIRSINQINQSIEIEISIQYSSFSNVFIIYRKYIMLLKVCSLYRKYIFIENL
jgi:hypothetical protein